MYCVNKKAGILLLNIVVDVANTRGLESKN
jgi:hypothetical protein